MVEFLLLTILAIVAYDTYAYLHPVKYQMDCCKDGKSEKCKNCCNAKKVGKKEYECNAPTVSGNINNTDVKLGEENND